MKEMRVGLGDRSYSIHVGHGCLEDVGQACKDLGLGQRLAIITNPTVADLYLEPVERSLGAAGFSVSVATMADGEEHKTLETAGSRSFRCRRPWRRRWTRAWGGRRLSITHSEKT